MHAMAQLRLAQRVAAIDSALQWPRPPHAPLCGIDAPRRDLIAACEEIAATRKAAKIAADWTQA